MYLLDVAAYRPKCCGFDLESEARCEAYRAHHAEFVFRKTPVGLADGADDFGLEVGPPAHEIEHFPRVVRHQQAVDRKVASPHIFLRSICVDHTVRVAAITVAHVRAERGNFDLQTITRNQDHSELCPD